MTLPEDTILENRYRIDSVLAHGGRGAIYRAFDAHLNTPLAIKENFFETSAQITQFKQEASMLVRLHHPALPQVTHYFSFEGQQYLVMEFIEGENLWEIVERRGQPLLEGEALDAIIQVCQAVNYLHRQTPPVVHRDIKPRNIKVTPTGQVKLVDFGIAKQIGRPDLPDQNESLGGIPQYSSPEQYSGIGLLPASDIYALGATLYAILTDQMPPNSVSRLTGDAKLKSPDTLNPKLSPQTVQAILHAMQLKPENRPPSVADWQATLESIYGSLPPARSTPITPAAKPIIHKQAASDSPPAQPSSHHPSYWLVDSAGMGYLLGLEPLTIGSQPEADVIIEAADVSGTQAQVKIEGERCLVWAEESAPGTYLNGHRLRAEWYPLNQGDVLVIGPARFYLTATRPARVAAPKTASTSAGAGHSARPLATAASAVSQPAQSRPPAKTRRAMSLIFGLMLVLLVIGIGGYLWFNPETLTLLPSVPQSGLATAPGQPQAAEATATGADLAEQDSAEVIKNQTQTADAMIVQTVQAATQLTVQARDNAEATRRAEATSTAQANQPATPETIPVSRTTTSTRQPTAGTVTSTPTPFFSTATATQVSTRQATPVATGPTLMPLKSRVSIDRIGVQEVIDVDINPKNPREVFVLVKKDGIYKSSSGGDGPWARIDLDGSALTSLVIDPTHPARLYASTWNAVLKSTDGGNTWDPKTHGLVANQVVDVVAIQPTNPNVLYAGIGETLVVSADGGETWSSQGYGAGLRLARIYAIALDPFNKGTMYVGGLAAALYKSEDSGQSFVPVGYNTGQGTYSIAVHPSQKGVYLAGINSGQAAIIKTENGTEFYSVSAGLLFGGGDSAYSAITYAPSSPDIVYTGSGYESNPDAKGIFKSIDGGETWNSINNGININRDTGFPYYVKSMAVHPTNPDIVFAATGSGLYKSVDGGESWNLR